MDLRRYPSADLLADVSDDDLVLFSKTEVLPASTLVENRSHELFQIGRYDWRGFRTLDYSVITLSRGYFTIVDKADMALVRQMSGLHANVQLCPHTGRIVKVYAQGRVIATGERTTLHRFLAGPRQREIIDHVNDYSLDNRSCNLWNTSTSANLAKRLTQRSATGLLLGVEQWGDKYRGKIQYKGEKTRSEEKWDTQEPAHAWYLEQFKRIYGRPLFHEHKPLKTYPQLPPEKPGYEDFKVFVPRAIQSIDTGSSLVATL